jgi:hypothetical protein
MNPKNQLSINCADPTNGIGGILCKTPRPGPRDTWAASSSPCVENGDRTQMDEVGVLLRRELFTACLDRCKIRQPATVTDAYMAALGIALSTMAAKLMQTAVKLANAETTQDDSEFPPDLRAVINTTAGRIATLDTDMAPAITLARQLSGVIPQNPLTTEEKARQTLESELTAGCVILTALAGTHDQNLMRLSSLLVAATAGSIEEESKRIREGDDDAEPN